MSRESEFLLVDISNTYTKIAPASAARVGRVHRVPTRGLGVKAFQAYEFGTLVLSSVVPEVGRRVTKIFAAHRCLTVGPDLELGVGIDYPRPATIGADRLANAAGAAALYGAPLAVVDFGTALTFDVISPARTYVGGVIAPGLDAMTDYLYQRTALLPRLRLQEPARSIGRSTKGAMLAGAVYGYRGLVAAILDRIRAELGVRRWRVVATGGYAALIAAKMPAIDAVNPQLTLEGLRVIGGLNRPR